MPLILKRLLITIIVVACGYYAIRFIASIQIAASFANCAKEHTFPPGKTRFKNEEEARAYANSIFECMDRRNGLLARLFFDKNEANRDLIYNE